MTDNDGDFPPGTAAVAAVRLWVATDGAVAGRLTTVDDLATPAEHVLVSTDIVELTRLLGEWIAATARRLSR